MQSVLYTGLVVVDDYVDSSGKALWLALTNKAAKLGFDIRVLLFAEVDADLRSVMPNGKRIHFEDAHVSPVTAADVATFFNDQATQLAQLAHQKALLVVDHLNTLVRRTGSFRAVVHALAKASQICPVLVRFERDPIPDLDYRLMLTTAATTLTLSRCPGGGDQICTTLTSKKDGGSREKVETWSVDAEGLQIVSKAFAPPTPNPESQPAATPDFGGPCHSERARKERAAVVLPYTRAQTQEGLVGLNANRGKPLGAKIEYFADKDDDLDDSDPEEELLYA